MKRYHDLYLQLQYFEATGHIFGDNEIMIIIKHAMLSLIKIWCYQLLFTTINIDKRKTILSPGRIVCGNITVSISDKGACSSFQLTKHELELLSLENLAAN